MTDNLRLWKRFADIDPQHTKPITGKPYKGTSPKPQYVIQLLTEMFGPVGEGFGWEVRAEGFIPLGEEVLHWCRIWFWWREPNDKDGYASPGFEAYGQTKAYMKTKSGLMMDEDAPKKSLTDAITKAASQIGIASNLFMGRWDDSRYVEEVNREFRRAEREEAQKPDSRPLVEQAGPMPNATEPVPDRDPAKVAASLMKLVGLAKTMDEFHHVLSRPKFDQAFEWLSLEAPRYCEMVKAAVDGAREKLENPIPLPPHLEEAMADPDLRGVDWSKVPEVMQPREIPRLGLPGAFE